MIADIGTLTKRKKMKQKFFKAYRPQTFGLVTGSLKLMGFIVVLAGTTFLAGSCKKQAPSVAIEEINAGNITASSKSNKKILRFSNLDWEVRPSAYNLNPGPNDWSQDNAWVDSQGRLHLAITKDKKTGKWFCAEVYTLKTFGLGKYEFKIEGRVDKLDRNVVFGLFNISNNPYHDEIDIEFAQWGKKNNEQLPRLWYNVSFILILGFCCISLIVALCLKDFNDFLGFSISYLVLNCMLFGYSFVLIYKDILQK